MANLISMPPRSVKVEKLIKELPSVPTDWSNGDVNLSERNFSSNGVSMQHVEDGTSVRETQSMLLERIASEMNWLRFYVTNAKGCLRALDGTYISVIVPEADKPRYRSRKGLFTEVTGENVLHKSKCNYSAIYNFGDSNSDTGTTSATSTMVYPPNGERFPGSFPTRNCDGRLIIDFITEELKLPYLSAYLDSIGSSYNHGANFAAGGSSIRQGGFSPFFLELQISQFIQFKSRTMALYNQSSHNIADAPFKSRLPKSMDFSKALYTLDIGQNDLSFGLSTSDHQSVRESIPDILSQFSQGVQQLYNEGARFFWIHNTGAFGCLPRTNPKYKPNPADLDSAGCRKSENEIVQEFNRQLKGLVLELRKKFPAAKFTYVDVYSAKYELTKNARNQGFVNPKKFCCGTTKSIYIDCGTKKITNGKEYHKCKNPSKYITWDGVHYSEAANRWLATLIVNGSFSDPPVPIGMACN